MSDELTPATFTHAVGGAFVLGSGRNEPAIELVLHSLVEHAPSPGAPRVQPFSLTFRGPPGPHLPQGTYELQHHSIGQHHMFLVPIGPDGDGCQQYEASFN